MSSNATDSALLRNLKRDLVAVREEAKSKKGVRVPDASLHLSAFCKSLELSIRHGLKDPNLEYFEVFRALAKDSARRSTGNLHENNNNASNTESSVGLHALVRHVVGEIETQRNLKTPLGRGRHFLRCCLRNGWLTSLVMSVRRWRGAEKYYHNDALILRNPNDSLMEILPIVERLHFDLNLTNLSFLCDTWELPDRRTFELLPGASDLGLMICSVEGRVVVSKVKAYSIAGEDGKIERGDVIDELDSTPTYGLPPESVADVVKRCSKRPLKVSVVKAVVTKTGSVFPPLKQLHAEAAISSEEVEKQWKAKTSRWRASRTLEDGEGEFDPLLDDEDDDEENMGRRNSKAGVQGGYNLLYIGSLKIGRVGDSSVLDMAIERVTGDPKKVHHPVTLRLMELGVKMSCNDTGDAVLHYTYPEISACGCSSTNHHYLAFIAGNDLCSLATEYLCHVFYSANIASAREIIAALADGFDRTKNAV